MTRSRINPCLLAVISLFFGVIWLSPVAASAAPVIQRLAPITGLRGATTLDTDTAGNLYIADSKIHGVVKFDKYGFEVGTFTGTNASGAGLAVAADGTLYVSAGDKVAILNPAGTLVGYLGQGAGEFTFAGAIDIDANGNVYVVDQTAGRIEVFAPGAQSGAIFAGLSFNGKINLAINSTTNLIYIANDNFATGVVPTLYIYDAGGVLRNSLAASGGFGATLIESFGGVTFDDAAYYYVSDSVGGTVRVMDVATDALLLTFGKNELVAPGSMAFDATTSRLFIISGGTSIDVYGVDGGSTPVRANTPPTTPLSITAGEVSSQTPALLFNNATDADGDLLTYNVKVLDAASTQVAGFTVAAQAGTTTAGLVPQALVENSSYFWQVQASDGLATSAWSAPKAIYINAVQQAPSAPVLTSFILGETAGNDAALTWTASVDADPFANLNYRVEIYDGVSLIGSSLSAGPSALVSNFSAQLTPGAIYAWQVVAVDNTALEAVSVNRGSFVFQTTILSVASNVDGARVYLGGHHGYAGRYLGVTPLEVRDLAAGSYSVVVEAAGFEPSVAAVTLIKDSAASVLADLKGATLASGFATHALTLGGQVFQGINPAPIVADLNQDGILDLLLADNGFLKFYAGSLTLDPPANETIENLSPINASLPAPALNRVVFSGPAQQLVLPQIAGAAPCLVDWNNDDKFDLLIGGADGSVNLFLGQGGLSFSSVAQWLVTTASQAIPVVVDFDADGNKDLVVSSGNELLLFANVGSDAAPVLNTQATLATLTAPAVPVALDWNADGSRELMLLSQGELFQTVISNGLVTSMVSTGLSVSGANSVFALNFAGSHSTDLVFASSTGLVVANGQQGEFVPAYKAALMAKLSTVELLVQAQDFGLTGNVATIKSRISRGQYDSALLKAEQLIQLLGANSTAGIAVAELAGILQ